MFGSSSFTSRPASLKESVKAPNLFFSMLKNLKKYINNTNIIFWGEIYYEFTAFLL